MRWLERLTESLILTGPILDPEDCLDTEQPTQRRVERWCVGDADAEWYSLGQLEWCERCLLCGTVLYEPEGINWGCQCEAPYHWSPCGDVGGCDAVVDWEIVNWDLCGGDNHPLTRMWRWPNPCAREV